MLKKVCIFAPIRLRELIAIDICSIKLFTYNKFLKHFIMEENSKIRSVEDSFDSSVSLYENLKKWVDTEFERLISRGRDIDKFDALTDTDSNELKIVCEEYTMIYKKDERAIDLVVNGEKNSSIWDDVVNSVPVQFASCIDSPMSFTYKISSSTSEEKEYYLFSVVGFNNFMPLFGLIPLEKVEEKIKENKEKIEKFDELIANIF